MAHSEGLKLTRVRFPFLFWKKGSQNRKLHKIIEEGSVERSKCSKDRQPGPLLILSKLKFA